MYYTTELKAGAQSKSRAALSWFLQLPLPSWYLGAYRGGRSRSSPPLNFPPIAVERNGEQFGMVKGEEYLENRADGSTSVA